MQMRVGRALRRQEPLLLRQHAQHDQPDDAHCAQRNAPSERGAQPETHDWRERIAEVAADAVRRIRMTQPPRRHVRIENREVRWVKHAVAGAHDRRAGEQPPGIGRERGGQRAAGQQRQARQQDQPGATAIDEESGGELNEATRDIERADDEPEHRPRDIELGAQQRKQRRKRELQEVRQAVRKADDADDAGIPAERLGGCGIQCG